MRKGAIVLCGGKSSRMGREKAVLTFGGEQMLQRLVRLLGDVVGIDSIVVVGAPSQTLPKLPENVTIVRDTVEFRGPLQGLATGMRAAGNRFDAVYASGCDVPLLVPSFVKQILDSLNDFDAAVPFDGEHYHPLAAAYRPSVLPHIEKLLAANRLRSTDLFSEINTFRIPVEQLRDVEPHLNSLANVNTPEQYQAALLAAGLGPSS